MITTIATPKMVDAPYVTWQLAALLGDAPIIGFLLLLGLLRYILYQVKQPMDCLPGLAGRRGRRKGSCCLSRNRRPRDSLRSVIGPDQRPRTSMTTNTTHSSLHLSKTSILLIWMMSIHIGLLAYLLSGSAFYENIPVIFQFEMDIDGTLVDLNFADIIVGMISALGGYLGFIGLSIMITTAKRRHGKILLRCRPVVVMIPDERPKERPRSVGSISIFQDTCSWSGSHSSINSLSNSPATSRIEELNHSPDQVRTVINPPSSNQSSKISVTGHRLASDYQPDTYDDDVDEESTIIGSPIQTGHARRLSSLSLDLITPSEQGNPLMRAKPPIRLSLSSSLDGSDVNNDDDDKQCRKKPSSSSPIIDQPGTSTAMTSDPPIRPVTPSHPGRRDVTMSPYTVSRLPVTTFGAISLGDDISLSSGSSSSSLNFNDDGDDILDLLNLDSPDLGISKNNNNNTDTKINCPSKAVRSINLNYITVAAVTVVVMATLAGIFILNFYLVGSPVDDRLKRWIVSWMMAAIISVVILLPAHCLIKSITARNKKQKQTLEWRSAHRPPPPSSSSSFYSIV